MTPTFRTTSSRSCPRFFLFSSGTASFSPGRHHAALARGCGSLVLHRSVAMPCEPEPESESDAISDRGALQSSLQSSLKFSLKSSLKSSDLRAIRESDTSSFERALECSEQPTDEFTSAVCCAHERAVSVANTDAKSSAYAGAKSGTVRGSNPDAHSWTECIVLSDSDPDRGADAATLAASHPDTDRFAVATAVADADVPSDPESIEHTDARANPDAVSVTLPDPPADGAALPRSLNPPDARPDLIANRAANTATNAHTDTGAISSANASSDRCEVLLHRGGIRRCGERELDDRIQL